MPSFLVESYLARGHAADRGERDRRARSAAEGQTHGTSSVRFEGSIHVPEDEICFYLFDAPTADAAARAAERAGLDPLRVVEALPSREEER